MLLIVLTTLSDVYPASAKDVGLYGLIVSNALLWERLRRLEKRFEAQFEEKPKSRIPSEPS